MAKTVIVRNGHDDAEASALGWIVAFLVLALGAWIVLSGGAPIKKLHLAADDSAAPTLNVNVNAATPAPSGSSSGSDSQ